MKKILLSMAIFAVATTAFSQLRVSENFSDYTSGNLGGKGTPAWVGSGTQVQITTLANNTGALTYPGYSSGQNYITLAKSNADDPYKPFLGNTTIATNAATSIYISFVVNVPASGTGANTDNTTSANHIMALRTNTSTSGAENLCYFYVADNNNTTQLKFGISKDDNVDGTYASGNFSFGTTYLILIRYDIVTSGADRMYMWVNPSLAAQPATSGYTPAANFISITTGFDGGTSSGTPDVAYAGSINALQFFQRSSGSAARLDGIKVASGTGNSEANANLNANLAWINLSPVGAPLPVKFGDIKGYSKNNGVQLDWTTYAEENVSHYDIERSADGKNFSSIGLVVSTNSSNEKVYNFFDASPNTAVNFYRVKNVDKDGQHSFTSIIRVDLGGKTGNINLYPNPVKGKQVTFQSSDLAKGHYMIRIYDNSGRQIQTLNLQHNGGAISQTITLSNSKPGFYTMLVDNNDSRVANKMFVIE